MGRFTNCLCLSLALLMLWGWTTQAGADDYPQVNIGHPISRALQKYTGITRLSGWIGSEIAETLLEKELGGQVDVSLKPFSATDLLAGKARRLRIRGENLLIDKTLPIRAFSVETLADSPLFIKKGRKPILLRPVAFQASAVLNEDNLKAFLESKQGRQYLTRIKVPLPPYKKPQYLDALDPAVAIEDGKLCLSASVNIHGTPKENGLPVQITTDIKPDGNTLKLEHVDIHIPGIQQTTGIERFLERFLTELFDPSKIRIERHKIILAYDKSELIDNRLVIEVHGLIKPDGKALARLRAER